MKPLRKSQTGSIPSALALLLIGISLTLGGCGFLPTQPSTSVPASSTLQLARSGAVEAGSSVEVTDPIELPSLCSVEASGGVIQWDVKCLGQLDAFEDIAIANTEIAQANANALRAAEGTLESQANVLQLHRELTQLKQDLLEEERRNHFWDLIFYRGLLIALAAGATF